MGALRGHWCDGCRGRGFLGGGTKHTASGAVKLDCEVCPHCEGVGFKGLTSAQVRQAEIDCHKEKV